MIDKISTDIVPDGLALDAASASILSALEALSGSDTAFEAFTQAFPGVFVGGENGDFALSDQASDLLVSEAMVCSASFTAEAVSLKFNPAERYLETVAAIVACVPDLDVVEVHGWPVLSLGGDTPSMTEAAGASSSSRGGSQS